MTDTMLEHALSYGAHGWPVFPLKGKAPAISRAQGGRGFHDAATDPAVITRMWARFPGANIGIRTGEQAGIAVLDVDGDAGRASLVRIESRHGPLPGTVTAITRNGCHMLYRWQPGIGVGAAVYGPGLDLRGEGGYIVAAPSLHPDSRRPYRWLCADHSEIRPWAYPLTPWPADALPLRSAEPERERLADVVPIDPMHRGVLAGLVRTVLNAPKGERNTTLNWASYRAGEHVRAGRLDLEQAVAALRLAAERIGLTPTETVKTIASGLSGAA